ncbi:N-acetyltransferase family protein [Primorskyibacter sp. S187A]|uniref:GNAT family N-acetyltransferase n=1 Tax=Primorskyibacter sp. S187A TaxID=3415130 RepID=UPI003C7EB685
MSLTLRDARSTDAGRVGAILSAFIDETEWMPRLHSRAEDISFAGSMIERGWVRVAETAVGLAGFIARDATEVNALYVAPEGQRQGTGTALLQDAMDASETLELWTFVLNTPARRFYAKHGFAELSRGDGSTNEEGLPDIRLRWQRSVS